MLFKDPFMPGLGYSVPLFLVAFVHIIVRKLFKLFCVIVADDFFSIREEVWDLLEIITQLEAVACRYLEGPDVHPLDGMRGMDVDVDPAFV
jgi:hypothetical protein